VRCCAEDVSEVLRVNDWIFGLRPIAKMIVPYCSAMSAEYPTLSDLTALSGQDAAVVGLEAVLPSGRFIKADPAA